MAILDLRLNPSKGELRWFGVSLWAFSAVVAGLVLWHAGSTRIAGTIVGAGSVLCLIYYSLRPLRLPIYRVWMRLFHPIGWLVSHAVLIGIYFLVITPIGWALRLMGYDPLSRRFDPEAESYWCTHDPADRAERYFRQF